MTGIRRIPKVSTRNVTGISGLLRPMLGPMPSPDTPKEKGLSFTSGQQDRKEPHWRSSFGNFQYENRWESIPSLGVIARYCKMSIESFMNGGTFGSRRGFWFMMKIFTCMCSMILFGACIDHGVGLLIVGCSKGLHRHRDLNHYHCIPWTYVNAGIFWFKQLNNNDSEGHLMVPFGSVLRRLYWQHFTWLKPQQTGRFATFICSSIFQTLWHEDYRRLALGNGLHSAIAILKSTKIA